MYDKWLKSAYVCVCGVCRIPKCCGSLSNPFSLSHLVLVLVFVSRPVRLAPAAGHSTAPARSRLGQSLPRRAGTMPFRRDEAASVRRGERTAVARNVVRRWNGAARQRGGGTALFFRRPREKRWGTAVPKSLWEDRMCPVWHPRKDVNITIYT